MKTKKLNLSLLFSQVIFEAEASDGAGFIAIDDIQVLSYPCGESLALPAISPSSLNSG